MQRCPTCRARVRSEPRCNRCGTDFTRLLAIEARAEMHLSRAIGFWLESDEERALQELECTLHLKQDALARLLQDYLIEHRSIRRTSDDRPAADWFWPSEQPDDIRTSPK